jgi:uncharacterized protein DUF6262
MIGSSQTWARNTSGLRQSAQQRAAAARKRVDDALVTLMRNPDQRVNFNTVSAAAGVTKAYLYKEPVLRERIDQLRREQAERQRRLEPRHDRTEMSTRLLLIAKDRRIRELENRLVQIEQDLATCRGRLYEQL